MAVPSPKRAWRQSRTRRASGRGPERVPAPFVVGVNRSGTTLLRMMLDAHPDLTVPPETHFVPDLIKAPRESGSRRPRALLEAITSQRASGATSASPRTSCSSGSGRSTRSSAGAALRAFYEAYAERAGKPRWGEKTPIYVQEHADDRAGASRGALRPRDPRRPRRRALDPRPGRASEHRDRPDRRALGEADHQGPRDRPNARPLQGDPLRGPDPRHRADAASGSASSSSCPGTTRCSTTTSAPPTGSRRWSASCPTTASGRR